MLTKSNLFHELIHYLSDEFRFIEIRNINYNSEIEASTTYLISDINNNHNIKKASQSIIRAMNTSGKNLRDMEYLSLSAFEDSFLAHRTIVFLESNNGNDNEEEKIVKVSFEIMSKDDTIIEYNNILGEIVEALSAMGVDVMYSSIDNRALVFTIVASTHIWKHFVLEQIYEKLNESHTNKLFSHTLSEEDVKKYKNFLEKRYYNLAFTKYKLKYALLGISKAYNIEINNIAITAK